MKEEKKKTEYYLDNICVYCLKEILSNHYVKLKIQSKIASVPRINLVCDHMEVKKAIE